MDRKENMLHHQFIKSKIAQHHLQSDFGSATPRSFICQKYAIIIVVFQPPQRFRCAIP
jgi:hypothetical protein